MALTIYQSSINPPDHMHAKANRFWQTIKSFFANFCINDILVDLTHHYFFNFQIIWMRKHIAVFCRAFTPRFNHALIFLKQQQIYYNNSQTKCN